ncbi:RagB/SusD family nutrient uptake outer membrane protein [Parafilimonas sp.]|uniref:RagB/SusD family nutrient uptake outer membrane protein n=1 Tax=Parafilimonas sp. TaxID=1969739 RepID=UPI0039E42D0C
MKFFKYIVLLSAICLAAACTKLDISPTNIISDEEIFGSESGIESYMARIYSEMPIEDFRYGPQYLFNHFYVLKVPGSMTGEALCREVSGSMTEATSSDYGDTWSDFYTLIRECNYFLETIDDYASKYSDDDVNMYKGECHFIRAFTYFALAKRYGGVPLVTRVLNYPEESSDEVDIARSSEEDTWNLVSSDFDSAISLLPESNQVGRANKYAAYAFKARAMLYAGSIAKYNTVSYYNGGVRLCGMSTDLATGFYTQAYEAAKAVEDGGYSLYMDEWASGDLDAQYKNYVDLFSNVSSSEAIFVKEYGYPESVHGYDAYNVPAQYKGANGYSAETNPTLDFVEMFDGIDKDADGHIDVYNSDGTYKLYDSTMELFKDAEPRLRATVILPGDYFKGESCEIWRGIYTGTATSSISRLIAAGSTVKYESSSSAGNLVTSSSGSQTAYTLHTGVEMNPAGQSGIFYGDNTCAMSGFSVRKWLDESLTTAEVLENNEDQPWIEMRYAEVLLTRAEAEAELADLGNSDYLDDAYTCIDKIRLRAGATLLTTTETSSVSNFIEAVRKERRKELAFENKTWWDLKRWRIIASEQSNTRWRTLDPFYADYAGKWFFDARYDETGNTYTFDTRWYYQQIPDAAITTSSKVVQNSGY